MIRDIQMLLDDVENFLGRQDEVGCEVVNLEVELDLPDQISHILAS